MIGCDTAGCTNDFHWQLRHNEFDTVQALSCDEHLDALIEIATGQHFKVAITATGGGLTMAFGRGELHYAYDQWWMNLGVNYRLTRVSGRWSNVTVGRFMCQAQDLDGTDLNCQYSADLKFTVGEINTTNVWFCVQHAIALYGYAPGFPTPTTFIDIDWHMCLIAAHAMKNRLEAL